MEGDAPRRPHPQIVKPQLDDLSDFGRDGLSGHRSLDSAATQSTSPLGPARRPPCWAPTPSRRLTESPPETRGATHRGAPLRGASTPRRPAQAGRLVRPAAPARPAKPERLQTQLLVATRLQTQRLVTTFRSV